MIDNASILALGCVGGLVLALGLGVVFALYTFGELRAMFIQWLDRK